LKLETWISIFKSQEDGYDKYKKYLENGSKSFDLGGVDYITKPFQHEEVMARVKTHVSLSRALMELKRKQV